MQDDSIRTTNQPDGETTKNEKPIEVWWKLPWSYRNSKVQLDEASAKELESRDYSTIELTVQNFRDYLPIPHDLCAVETMHLMTEIGKIPSVANGMKEIGMKHLYDWCLPHRKDILYKRAVEKGFLQPDVHKPGLFFLPGLKAQGWWDAQSFEWVKTLEENYKIIQKELLELRSDPSKGWQTSQYYNRSNAENGQWTSFYFYQGGGKNEKNCSLCPKTVELLEKHVPFNKIGTIAFSALTPETNIKPHFGEINWEIRCQVPLIHVEDARMRVGTEVKRYAEGKCFVFDDTFEHCVWNDNKQFTRIVLLFDVIHPGFAPDERKKVAELLEEYRTSFKNHSMKEQEKTSSLILAKDWWRD